MVYGTTALLEVGQTSGGEKNADGEDEGPSWEHSFNLAYDTLAGYRNHVQSWGQRC